MKLYIKKFFEKIKDGNLIVHLSLLSVFIVFLFFPFSKFEDMYYDKEILKKSYIFFIGIFEDIEVLGFKHYIQTINLRTILYFILPSIISLFWIISICICKKVKIFAKIIPCIPIILFFLFFTYFLTLDYYIDYKKTFQIGFYLYLIYAIVCISFYLYLLYEHYTKTHKTKSQRIAELERQVAELKSKTDIQ